MQINWAAHWLRRDDPRDKTYYIIRRRDTNVGLFSNYIVFAGHIRFALANGLLPVIDMKNYPNSYLEPERLGKVNAWEYYFRQPLGLTLDEAYCGHNVLMSSGEPVLPFPCYHNSPKYYRDDNGQLTEWRMLVKLGLLRLQPSIEQSINAEYKSILDQMGGGWKGARSARARNRLHHSPTVQSSDPTARRDRHQDR